MTAGTLAVTGLAALDLAALALAAGALVSDLWIQQRPRGPGWSAFALALAGLTASSLGLLWVRTAVMSGRALGSALPEVPAVLSGTHFGRIWLVRLGALTAGWATCVPGWRPHGRRWSARLALLCIAVVAFTRSATTHAADGGDFTPLEMMDWLHLVAASVWIGCVCTASLTPPLAAERTDAALRLSRVSGITLGIALLTGAASGWWMVGGFGALVTTPYGRVLSIKLALVSVLVCIGAWNRFGLLRPLRRQLASSATVEGGDGGAAGLMRQLARSLLVEGFVMAGLLVVVAHLLQMRPPRP